MSLPAWFRSSVAADLRRIADQLTRVSGEAESAEEANALIASLRDHSRQVEAGI